MRTIRLGTRGSKLALWQAHEVARQLQEACPGIQIEMKIIHTQGDKILDVALSKIGDKGLFTKEIEKELIEGRIDLAVHSFKDMPTLLDHRLCIGAVTRREDPSDVLLSHRAYTLDSLPAGAKIGTSSLRRVAQLKHYRPDLEFVELRGNVETRINKMKSQGLDGIILAYAGVMRLGFEAEITEKISPEIMLPAVGQGAIAIETRCNEPIIEDCLSRIHDSSAAIETAAERSFLKELEGGCQVPIACLARAEGTELFIQGLVSSLDGKQFFKKEYSCSGSLEEAQKAGQELARQLIYMGAGDVLEEIRKLGEKR